MPRVVFKNAMTEAARADAIAARSSSSRLSARPAVLGVVAKLAEPGLVELLVSDAMTTGVAPPSGVASVRVPVDARGGVVDGAAGTSGGAGSAGGSPPTDGGTEADAFDVDEDTASPAPPPAASVGIGVGSFSASRAAFVEVPALFASA
jgi:hypothetical protein